MKHLSEVDKKLEAAITQILVVQNRESIWRAVELLKRVIRDEVKKSMQVASDPITTDNMNYTEMQKFIEQYIKHHYTT